MRTPCCHSFLAFILKFLNFLQAFVGVAIIVYSAYLLNQWNHHHHQFPPPHESGGAPLPAGVISPPSFAYGVVNALGFDVNSLPAFWFIYAFMGVGILVCCITFIGHIGAEAINGCCLCFDIPFDPTGELDSFRTFIEDNVDVFIEDDDLEGDYDFRSSNREPLLAPYSSQASVSARGDSDIWSSRMRDKYGLNSGDAKSTLNPSIDAKQ
ncbi:tetraspanin-18 [Phtheirospermum japonicum]|uniref:Tetraspanin-18 n=1 Tax=Phtheirospermum japonicum TaxID=374723 RepID=A0A830B5V4_9LAMI|nr:tetraspanin-18 [Phtheirospermum japonicum]